MHLERVDLADHEHLELEHRLIDFVDLVRGQLAKLGQRRVAHRRVGQQVDRFAVAQHLVEEVIERPRQHLGLARVRSIDATSSSLGPSLRQ